MIERPIRTTVIGSYPFPSWLEFASQNLDAFGHSDILEMQDDAYIRRANYLLWVGHNLERMGDRAINIAERVVFMVTNQYIEDMVSFD